MQIEIENYRGWVIKFDTDKENFYCHSDQYDREDMKKSYSSAKSFIDDFIKENNEFKPFWVEGKPESFNFDKKIKLIGIRKDKCFIYEDSKGNKKKLSEYEEDRYIVYNSDNDKYRIEIAELNKQIDSLKSAVRGIESQIVGRSLKDLKNDFIIG